MLAFFYCVLKVNYNYSMRNIKSKYCFFAFFFYTIPLHADTIIETSFKLLDFDYEEFDDSGDSFNKENGIIPGISIIAITTNSLSKFSHSIGYEVYDGQVDYDGMTQSKTLLTTDTDETLYRLFYELNWSPENHEHSVYGKVTWQQWDRDIQPVGIVSGLFEQYRWWTLELGFIASLYKDNLHTWLFKSGASRISNGTIEIDLSRQGFGQPELKLGNGSGITTALMYQYTVTERSKIGFSLQYQHWTFGKSNSIDISNGFILIRDVNEPRSVSNHSTVSLNYQYHF